MHLAMASDDANPNFVNPVRILHLAASGHPDLFRIIPIVKNPKVSSPRSLKVHGLETVVVANPKVSPEELDEVAQVKRIEVKEFWGNPELLFTGLGRSSTELDVLFNIVQGKGTGLHIQMGIMTGQVAGSARSIGPRGGI